MARYNDNSYRYEDWSPRKLLVRLRETANLETFCDSIFDGDLPPVKGEEGSKIIRERTRIYRESWINPIIDELEKRLIKK